MSCSFESLEELLNKVDVYSLDDKEHLFRGHLNSEYLIQPSIFRINNASEHDIYSYIMTKHYDVFKGMKPLEVLSKMQHLGVATRLLDLTQNPLVGLFFAVDSFSLSKKQEKASNKCCIKSCPFFRSKCAIIEGAKKKRFTRFSPSFLSRCKCEYSITKKSNPELLIFNYEKYGLKDYNSDTVKMLSCLPLLKEENQKKLLFDAINEYLIQVFVTHALSMGFYDDDGKTQLTKLDPLNGEKSLVLKEILQKTSELLKRIYYLDEEYKTTNSINLVLQEIGLKYFGGKEESYTLNKTEKSLYRLSVKIINENGNKNLFDVSKIKIIIGINFLSFFDTLDNKKTEMAFRFNRKNTTDFPIVLYDVNNSSYRIEPALSENYNKILYEMLLDSLEDRMSQKDNPNIYRSKSMEELYYKVKSFYPEFTRCARPLDIINGVYVYPIVNTDRMRAQKGLFALYGLSQYWDFKRYMEYQESSKVEFYEAINLFLENNLASQKERKSVDIRKMEDYIYEIERVSIDTNKTSELKSALKKLGIDKETLGCSLETTYNKYIED